MTSFDNSFIMYFGVSSYILVIGHLSGFLKVLGSVPKLQKLLSFIGAMVFNNLFLVSPEASRLYSLEQKLANINIQNNNRECHLSCEKCGTSFVRLDFAS